MKNHFCETFPLIYTIKNRCRVCYTCVRECPAKAIKIINGQAEVITERCIACGNCVKVCSQGAKNFYRSGNAVLELLQSKHKTAACIAPAFPAEFFDVTNDYKLLVGMLRKLGFDFVTEVSFGADLTAAKYAEIFKNKGSKSIISSDCPAVVYYIEQYHPELIDSLAPIDSPAMAMAKVVKRKYGEEVKPVFIGPCTAKKAESDSFEAVLTFSELRDLFNSQNITPKICEASEFDPPHAGKGAIFPISRGLLQTVDTSEGFKEGEVLVAEGKNNFREAIDEFENGLINKQHLELLCCEGCIMGAGMSTTDKRFVRRVKVSNYVEDKLKRFDADQWKKDMNRFSSIDLTRSFSEKDRRIAQPEEIKIQEVLTNMGKTQKSDMLNCGACGYKSCHQLATAVVEGLAEQEMCLPYTIKNLNTSIDELHNSNRQLANTRQALLQSEKLASMGQVSAGIAHELNNPLGVISLYSSILKDETDKENPMYKDLNIIDEQAQRCKKIVGGLLNFARKNQVNHEKCRVASLVEESFAELLKPDTVEVIFDNQIGNTKVDLDRDKIMQVFTNLEKNAVEAMPQGGILTVKCSDSGDEIKIEISDTGTGISQENMEKIFTPFFTTKDPGKGTGLGLPLVYGIVKMHKGQILVNSNTDTQKGPTGTTFTIKLPKYKQI